MDPDRYKCFLCFRETRFRNCILTTGTSKGVHQTVHCEFCGAKNIVQTISANGQKLNEPIVTGASC